MGLKEIIGNKLHKSRRHTSSVEAPLGAEGEAIPPLVGNPSDETGGEEAIIKVENHRATAVGIGGSAGFNQSVQLGIKSRLPLGRGTRVSPIAVHVDEGASGEISAAVIGSIGNSEGENSESTEIQHTGLGTRALKVSIPDNTPSLTAVGGLHVGAHVDATVEAAAIQIEGQHKGVAAAIQATVQGTGGAAVDGVLVNTIIRENGVIAVSNAGAHLAVGAEPGKATVASLGGSADLNVEVGGAAVVGQYDENQILGVSANVGVTAGIGVGFHVASAEKGDGSPIKAKVGNLKITS